jgi:hypothetical protein
MSNETVSITTRASSATATKYLLPALVLLVLLALAGATSIPAHAGDTTPPATVPRTENDAIHNRVWTLEDDAAYVYSASTQALIQRIELPNWIAARRAYSCAPDIAISPNGDALVTSNVRTIIWRVDAGSLTATPIEIATDSDHDKDFGFTGLVYVDAKTLIAFNAFHGTLWQIDIAKRTARKISTSSPIRGTCGISVLRSIGIAPKTGVVTLWATGRRSYKIALASSLKTAKVMKM